MFQGAYNDALPVQIKRYRVHSDKCKPWITSSLIKSVRKKHKLYKNYLSTRSQSSKDLYIKYKNKLTKILRAAEKKYYSDKFDSVKENIRDTWKLINNVLNDATGAGQKPSVDKIKCNESIIDDPKSIAAKFNDYFVNIGPNLARIILIIPNKSITDTLPNPNKNSMFVTPCTSNEIISIVKN